MIVYVILIISILIFGMLFQKNNKKVYSIIMMILFTLIAGLRHYTIGNDTANYVDFYSKIHWYEMEIFDISRFEKGYIALNLLIAKTNLSYTFFLLVCAAITNFFVCRFIRENSKNMCISFLLFVLCLFFFQEMNIIRQFLAMAIFLFSLKYIKERKLIKYIICILLAGMMHNSAFMMIPLYFLYGFKLNIKNISIIVFITLITYMFFHKILVNVTMILGLYQGYVESMYGSDKLGNVISFLMYLCIFIFLYIVSKNKDKTLFDEFMLLCVFILAILNFLAIKISVFTRVAMYLSVLITIAIPNFIENYIKTSDKKVMYFCILICFSIYCFVILYFRPNWNYVVPYEFFWR